ncbi:enoyl-[acyl-carrier-protein] reductase [NADH], chloroplastic-like [Cucurbita maxima]|uniref:Enoyl-[acyl-carrier-protein] reductase [NADH], chloroplastic-like n=1 Tax=Cucurbita maxima TaxID=3661 RepID=A0A6J1HU33_CUCMA|nr:enoyl-[acyl-carrier-protein] reductase [NADH], chloroplastic-like [Cucurbita maxima]
MSTTGAYNIPMCTLRNSKLSSAKLKNVYNVSALKHFQLNSTTLSSTRTGKIATSAMSGSNEHQPVSGLPIDLKGKRAFIAGVALMTMVMVGQ